MVQWRLLDEGKNEAAWNMAVDEAILTCYSHFRQPTFRLYGWCAPTLSLGYFQSIDTVDAQACHDHGIDIVRRPTGGRAVLHHEEITYSLFAGLRLFPAGVAASYRSISQILIAGLGRLGLDAQWQRKHTKSESAVCFDTPAFAELTIGGKKVIGSAQTRTKHALLQHGAIPLRFDWNALATAVRLTPAAIRLLKRQAAGLHDFSADLDISQVRHALLEAFHEGVGSLQSGTLFPEERAKAEELMHAKYDNPAWTNQKETRHAVDS